MATALAVSRRAEQVAAAPGRPRSDQAHQAVLKATRELLLKHPSDEVRIEHIAARAGVGKATIYRHWPTRDALVQELLLELAGPPQKNSDKGQNPGGKAPAVLH